MEGIFVDRCVRFFAAFVESPEIWDAVWCVETESVPGNEQKYVNKRIHEHSGQRYEYYLNEMSYFQETLAASEKTGGKPHQLPATFFAQSIPVVSQLFHDLTINFISKNFVFQWPVEDKIGILVTDTWSFRWQITHVFQDRVKSKTRFLG